MRAARCIGRTALAAVLALAGHGAAQAVTTDAWITTRAKTALLATEGLPEATINVDTVNGRVTLHGRVRTADEKARAEDAVRNVDGVKGVRNILQVVGGSRARLVKHTDSEIRKGSSRRTISSLSPLYDRTRSTSCGWIMPRSPCIARVASST